MENTNVNVTNNVAAEEVKHMLQLFIGAEDLQDCLSQIRDVKAKAVVFTPGELTTATSEKGKTMTLCNYQISKVLDGGAVGIKTNATIRYNVYGLADKAVAIKAEPMKDMVVAFAADQLEALAGVVSKTDTLAFVVNTTDRTCTVKVVSSNGGAFRAEMSLPIVDKYIPFEVKGKELASATVLESDISVISKALSSICVDIPKEWMNSVSLGFGGEKLKVLITNSVMFMPIVVENSTVVPCESKDLYLLKKDDFSVAAGLVKAGGKVKISLRGKDTGEVTGFAFEVENGPVATFSKYNINGGVCTASTFDMFRGLGAEQDNRFVFDKEDIEKAFHLQEIGNAGVYMASFEFDNETDIKLVSYGGTTDKASTVKGKVQLSEEAKARKYIFRTNHFLGVLSNLVLHKIEDENGKEIGKERVTVYITDKAFCFANVRKGTVLGIGIASTSDADNLLKLQNTKKEPKAKAADKKDENAKQDK